MHILYVSIGALFFGALTSIACGGGSATPTASPGIQHGHAHSGTEFALGTKAIAGFEVSVLQIGAPPALHAFTVKVSGEQPPETLQCFVWLADAAHTAMYSSKEQGVFQKATGGFDVHLQRVATEVPPGAKVWVALKEANGKETTATFDLHR